MKFLAATLVLLEFGVFLGPAASSVLMVTFAPYLLASKPFLSNLAVNFRYRKTKKCIIGITL